MESLYRKFFVIISILLYNCKSAKIKTPVLIPQNGEIVFSRKNIVTDQKNFDNSISKLIEKFKISLEENDRKEKKENLEDIDEKELAQILELSNSTSRDLFESMFKNSTKGSSYHKFQDSLIISYKKNGKNIFGDYTVINKEKSTYYKLSKRDSITKFMQNKKVYFKDESNMTFKIFTADIKLINGYKCFRIEVEVNENIEGSDEEYLKIFGVQKTIYDLYVTTKIKCNYHPVFQYKSILEKYYPLEIIEKNSLVPESQTHFTLEEFSLN